MARVVLLTFADSRMRAALSRVKRQARACRVFDEIWVWNEKALSRDFRLAHKDLLRRSVRGFGYWVWKPEVIRQALERLSDGDILLWVDAGCHLNPRGRARLLDYISRTQHSTTGVLATVLDLPEENWTKADVAEALGVRTRNDIMRTGQIQSGTVFFRVGSLARALVSEWQSLYQRESFYFDDSPSTLPNAPGFREHRHDQSLFSILAKLRGIDTFPATECWTGSGNWNELAEFPIHHRRDRSSAWAKFRKRIGRPGGLRKEVVRTVLKAKRLLFRESR